MNEDGSGGSPRRGAHASQFEAAYDRLEELLVAGTLRPGSRHSIQELQAACGLGRTPVYQAVSRLAGDTMLVILPRHGVLVRPIDLARDRLLLALRRDIERFVVRLAADRAGATHRNQMRHLSRTLVAHRENMTADELNRIDRRIDRLILAAAGEPFLEHTLRPLHTVFRRIGALHAKHVAGTESVVTAIDRHAGLLDAVATGVAANAVKASDDLIEFVDAMIDGMEMAIDPSQLDCSLEPLDSFRVPVSAPGPGAPGPGI